MGLLGPAPNPARAPSCAQWDSLQIPGRGVEGSAASKVLKSPEEQRSSPDPWPSPPHTHLPFASQVGAGRELAPGPAPHPPDPCKQPTQQRNGPGPGLGPLPRVRPQPPGSHGRRVWSCGVQAACGRHSLSCSGVSRWEKKGLTCLEPARKEEASAFPHEIV